MNHCYYEIVYAILRIAKNDVFIHTKKGFFMKAFNKILFLVALCAINSISAKRTAYTGGPGYTGGTGYTGGNEPGKKTGYEPLSKYIQSWRTTSPLKNVSNRVVFGEQIQSIQNFIQTEKLSADVFRFILQVIRDTHFKFTGNDAKDLIILQDSNKQIDFLVDKLGKIDYTAYTNFLGNAQEYQNRLNAAQ